MTEPDLPLRCQLGDCGNRAALTVTIDLPVDWSESREYNVVTLQVAVCGDCAQGLQGHGNTLIAARVQYSRLREKAEEGAQARSQLVALVEAVGAPYEPVQGSVFGRWLAALDRSAAQAAWRLLAHVKRRRVGGALTSADDPITASVPANRGRDQAPTGPPLRIDGARLRRRVLVPPTEPAPPSNQAPATNPPTSGDDDAA